MSKDSSRSPDLAAALKADYELAKTKGASAKMIAAELGRSDSWAYEMIRGEQPFPLKHLDVWVRLTGGINLARWVAEVCNCDLVPRTDMADAETTVLTAMREAMEAVYSAGEAIEDGVVTDDEVRRYREEMDEAIEHLRRLENVLKTMCAERRLSGGRAATLRDA